MKITWLTGRLDGWTTGRSMVRLLEHWDLQSHPVAIVCWDTDQYVSDACDRLSVSYHVFPGSRRHNLSYRRGWWRSLQQMDADIWHCWSTQERRWIRAAQLMGASHPPLHLSVGESWEFGKPSPPTVAGGPSSTTEDARTQYARLLNHASRRGEKDGSVAIPTNVQSTLGHSQRWRIATISRMQRNCRVEHLIWSLALLHHNFPSVWLDICGEGPAKPRIARFAKCTRTTALTFVDNATRWSEILNRAQCLWLGNDEPGTESLVREALAREIPVVAADSAWSRQFGEHHPRLYRVPAGRAGRADLARLTTRWLIERCAQPPTGSSGPLKSCG